MRKIEKKNIRIALCTSSHMRKMHNISWLVSILFIENYLEVSLQCIARIL